MEHNFHTFCQGLSCGFCHHSEQGTHGEIKREWSQEWLQFIPLCRKHSIEEDEQCQSSETQD
jgi:hypothetical protein